MARIASPTMLRLCGQNLAGTSATSGACNRLSESFDELAVGVLAEGGHLVGAQGRGVVRPAPLATLWRREEPGQLVVLDIIE
jgi:hypothetical protein